MLCRPGDALCRVAGLRFGLIMRDYFVALGNLCRFRIGPEDLPYSPAALIAVIAAEIACSVVGNGLIATASALPSPWRVVWSSLLTQICLYGVLRTFRKSERFVQTALGWNSITLVFNLFTVPILVLLAPFPTKGEDASALQMLLIWPVLALLVWVCVALVRVTRQALETQLAAAVLLTLAVLLIPPLIAAV